MSAERFPVFGAVAVGLLLLCSSAQGRSRAGTNENPRRATPPQAAATKPSIGAACVFCHRAEVEGYARSAMAHSLRRAAGEPDGVVKLNDGTVTIRSTSSGFWQRLQAANEVTNYRVDYVIGSGTHASGYLVDLAGHLFQSPVAYYKSRHAYDLAPGYEGVANPDFTRPVADACLFCHSGAALHIAGTSNRYRSPVFAAEEITCERCHGPSEKHLADPRAGTIVNPAKLDFPARDSVCEQCHLLGVGRVLNPGKQFEDFRAGERLEEVFTTYCNALPPGADAGKFKVISHVEQLARSTCSRQSNGRLWCGTCHDPHSKPAEPIGFYRSKCLGCHTGKFAAGHPGQDSNCIGCHMPRRDAKDGGHTAFTDHRIQRRTTPETPLPADVDIAAWREPASYLQKRNLGIAYVNVGGERRSPPLIVRGYRMLTEVQDQFPSDSAIFTAMGTALLLGKKTSEAELAFERAAQLDPQSPTAETNAASAYLQGGDVQNAKAHMERALTLDPLDLPAALPLIEIYKQQGDAAKGAELSARLSLALQDQSEPGEHADLPTSSPQGQTPFKNIQVLKSISSDQLIPAMRFITASLGVDCSYCHVQDHFDRDDKKTKQIARDMMRMTFAINRQDFEGNREVTCYSCHRGALKPEATPLVAAEALKLEPARAGDGEKLTPNLPTVDQLLARYVQALGGEAALEKITSREEKGTVAAEGMSASVEISEESPDELAMVRHMPAGDSKQVFDGHSGWSTAPGRPLREMRGADLDAARMDADLQFPLHIRKTFPDLRLEYPEKVGDREAFVLAGKEPGEPEVKFYFDEHSGLLLRLVRYAESPLGLDPTQIDYADYRDADGVKVPLRWTISQPGESSTVQVEQIQQNVPIDAAIFKHPPSRNHAPGDTGRQRPSEAR